MLAERRRRKLLERQRREVGPNGWTCHICRDYRPDALIGVFSRSGGTGVVAFRENIRYCIDRPGCVEGAKSKSWLFGSPS